MLRRSITTAALSTLTLSLTVGCGAENPEADTSDRGDKSRPTPAAAEVAAPEPRLAVTYDGGVLVLDAASLEVLDDLPLDGFARLSPAGDDRHLMVSEAGRFRALDLGSWTDSHGDHGHSFTGPPHLTETSFAAKEPGHVVRHDGRTVLFDDGTGTITSFDPADLDDGDPETRTMSAPEAHHGVAVELADGTKIHTIGDEETRTGVVVVDADGRELLRNEDCPGVHGEAFAGEVAVFGCEDGVLLVDGTKAHKIDSPDDYGRIGNQAGSEESPILLGDYKVDADAELERPTRVSLIDTRKRTMRLVDVGTSYTFRSLGRGPAGEGLVLGTDGALRVIDPVSGKVTRRIPVTATWQEPVDWQAPRPMLFVLDETAYVTEPGSKELHAVDLTSGEVTRTGTLPEVPNELSGTRG